MGYFADNYDNVRYPIDDENCLRAAQFGAISGINKHFTTKSTAAIVAMPTGSGKTAVLIMAAFTLRASRVLVITPSKLVRNQIAEQFKSLDTLRRIGVLVDTTQNPRVFEAEGYQDSPERWDELANYDVVVATPKAVSPSEQHNIFPPEGLFDLLLIDEAHHSPAKSWQSLISTYPEAKNVLFTATPFRRDKKEIKGSYAYEYSLRQAYDDEIFGKINFEPVTIANDESSDVATAKKAEEIYRRDESAGYDHRLMVRTDRKNKANYLRDVYTEHTDLNLQVIHSGALIRTR